MWGVSGKKIKKFISATSQEMFVCVEEKSEKVERD